jgi:pyruvate dehydrogenase E2 component (dihydrolipoamide acetyltransferase)
MAKDYVMPKLAMAMNEGTIAEWLVDEGAKVNKGDIIAAIETEKTAYDIESPEAGYFHIVLPAGETVDCGTVIGQFADDEAELVILQTEAQGSAASKPPADTASSEPVPTPQLEDTGLSSPKGRLIASPLARKLATDRGLSLELITGTGPGGRIVKRDVLAAEASSAPLRQTAVNGGVQELARIAVKGARKTIADRMTQSLQTTAQLSSAWESDVTDLLSMRRKFVAREEQLGTRVSVNAFIAKAIVYAIDQVPIANACLQGSEIVIYKNVNLGFAVSMPGQSKYDSSLLVPVLKNIENLGLVELDLRMKELVDRVRTRQFTEDDLSGSTITLSTTAGLAPPGHRSTPILNQPNAMLIGPSTTIERPVIVDGAIVPRTLLPMSVTFDHRILDGDPAVRFMSAVHDALENPELLMA